MLDVFLTGVEKCRCMWGDAGCISDRSGEMPLYVERCWMYLNGNINLFPMSWKKQVVEFAVAVSFMRNVVLHCSSLGGLSLLILGIDM
jgi:hypothetical protein